MVVVVATRNRRASLLRALTRLVALPERPHVIVVDNASTDGTAEAVAAAFPRVEVVRLAENRGAAARNVGVRRARAPYVAFNDDDSWCEPGALRRAAEVLDAYPHVALLAACIAVGPHGRLDPTCVQMAESPLTVDVPLPGPAVLGFVACGAVVRRSAFLAVGGFSSQLGFVGEERMLAVDLASKGWHAAYVPEIVAYHDPAPRNERARRRLAVRNDLWFVWLRLRFPSAVRSTAALAWAHARDVDGLLGMVAAVRGLRAIVLQRRPVPVHVERALRRIS
jgi:GT2 family glycosyltransferase